MWRSTPLWIICLPVKTNPNEHVGENNNSHDPLVFHNITWHHIVSMIDLTEIPRGRRYMLRLYTADLWLWLCLGRRNMVVQRLSKRSPKGKCCLVARWIAYTSADIDFLQWTFFLFFFFFFLSGYNTFFCGRLRLQHHIAQLPGRSSRLLLQTGNAPIRTSSSSHSP